MGITKKDLEPQDIQNSTSTLNINVDFIEEDMSSSLTRQAQDMFVTGGIGPGVTSSLFQTCFDQDFTYEAANKLYDITVGLWSGSNTVQDAVTGVDAFGKMLFASSSLMMREKVNVYRQMALILLGDVDGKFFAPHLTNSVSDRIDEACFITFKRLFFRDGIKPETFAMTVQQTASLADGGIGTPPNLNVTSILGTHTFTDLGGAINKTSTAGGYVAALKDATDSSRIPGIVFYDAGVVVLDCKKFMSGAQFASGTISAVNTDGFTSLGNENTETALTSKFIPDFMVSASIDNIVDHLASTRFQSGSLSWCNFTNITFINSTLIYCEALPDEFNYSSNPTYINPDTNKIVFIEPGQEAIQKSAAFISGIGLYSSDGALLAVAKTSRFIYKDHTTSLKFKVRLDF